MIKFEFISYGICYNDAGYGLLGYTIWDICQILLPLWFLNWLNPTAYRLLPLSVLYTTYSFLEDSL
jgi:hypothetical protein